MKFLFALNGSTNNRGCEAILLSTYSLLKDTFPEAQFINCSFKDYRVKKVPYLSQPDLKHMCHPELFTWEWLLWQIAKRYRRFDFNFQRVINKVDYVLSLGGDNYSMDYGTAWNFFKANDIIISSGKKLVLWGCSVGLLTKTLFLSSTQQPI